MIRKSFEIVNLFFVLLSIFVCFLKTGVSFLFLLTIGASYPFYMRLCSFWCKHCTLFLTKWNPHGTRLGKLAVFPDPNWLCAPGANITNPDGIETRHPGSCQHDNPPPPPQEAQIPLGVFPGGYSAAAECAGYFVPMKSPEGPFHRPDTVS